MTKRARALALYAYSTLAVGAVAFGPPTIVAAILLSPLVLFAPGYGIVLALNPRTEAELPGHRTLLAVTLSLIVVVLGGLLLNVVYRLDDVGWVVWLAAVSASGSVVALVRADRTAGADRPASTVRPCRRWRASGIAWVGAGAAVITLAASAALTEISSRAAFDKPVMQLSLLPGAAAQTRSATLVVTNLTGRAVNVNLLIEHGRQRRRLTLALDASQSWSGVVHAPAAGVVRALLAWPHMVGAPDEVIWHPTTSQIGTSHDRRHRPRAHHRTGTGARG